MKRVIFYVIGIAICSLLIVSCASANNVIYPAAEETVITVDGGDVMGTASSDGRILSFKGIPYAAAPMGELRWKDPQDAEPWEGVLVCDSFGNNPIQYGLSTPTTFSAEFSVDVNIPQSEDCLTLNIWTLNGETDMEKPVIVYIPGGGYVMGGSSCSIYDGEAIARKGVVFVSVNYRLGGFGFLASSEISDNNGRSGNYAVRDVLKALEWVRDNISPFGGDSSNVTLMGQSAGGRMVGALLESPLAAGLFSRAFIASAPVLGSAFVSREDAEALGDSLFEGLSYEQMMALDTREIVDRFQRNTTLVKDDAVFSDDADSRLSGGNLCGIPVVHGFVNGDAGGVFSGVRFVRSADAFNEFLEKYFGDRARKLAELYPAEEEKFSDVLSEIEFDMYLGRLLTETGLISRGTGQAVYAYCMTHPYPQESKQEKTNHTDDIAYWLNNLAEVRDPYLADYDRYLADAMSDYLVAFAADGIPCPEKLAAWDEAEGSRYILFGEEIEMTSMSPERLEFWKEYYGQ